MKTLCSTFFFLTAMTQPRQVCLHFPFDSLHVFQSVRTLQAMTSDRTGQSWNCSQPQHRSTLFRYPQVGFLSSHTSNFDDRDPTAAVANIAWRRNPDVVQYVPLGKYCLPCEPQFNGHPTWLASNDTSIVKKARHVFSRHVCASAGGGKQTSEVDPALPGLGPRDWTAWDNDGW